MEGTGETDLERDWVPTGVPQGEGQQRAQRLIIHSKHISPINILPHKPFYWQFQLQMRDPHSIAMVRLSCHFFSCLSWKI